MKQADHFHATYITPDGQEGEIEGGWTGYPTDYDEYDLEMQHSWIKALCINWGMPASSKVTRFWLAG